jgi:hypothetical protein
VDAGGNAQAVTRRTRLAASLSPHLSQWLRGVTRVHAHLCQVVRLYGKPRATQVADEWRARALAGDKTILLDAVTLAISQLESIRGMIDASMGDAEPVNAAPGSAEKLQALVIRAERYQSLFVAGDMEIQPPMDRHV